MAGVYLKLIGPKINRNIAEDHFIQKGEFIERENVEVKDKMSFLLLGHGGEGHSGGGLSDTIISASVDFKEKKVLLLSIPRDLAFGSGGGLKKINSVYLDGPTEMEKAVFEVTGIQPDAYVSVDFNQMQKIIDEIGGIEVDVPVAFDDYFYPVRGRELFTCDKTPQEVAKLSSELSGFELEKQFECRYEHLHFDKGLQKMKGETALKFVRSRHSAQHGGDFARSQRQFALLKGVLNKMISIDAVKNYDKVFEDLKDFVKSDVNLEIVKQLVTLTGNVSEYKIVEVTLSTENVLNDGKSSNGAYILTPKAGAGNFSGVQKYIQEELGKI